ncbi:hypothetical protein ACFWC5_41040 [Streptomyces sp. NPDC060085]|uniref:hypothetical protein n=1 Tax=Streptomyces sp. NPDC060085 TaxID=3347054 RepID=UPI003646DEC7
MNSSLTVPSPQTPAPLACHLCSGEAVPVIGVSQLPASGQELTVALCAPCDSGRPGRCTNRLQPADYDWVVLERNAAHLLAAFHDRQWVPYAQELVFAEDLAWFIWTEETLRAAVRAAGPWAAKGRLIRILDSSAFLLLREVPATDPALHTLRRLIDTLAAAAA